MIDITDEAARAAFEASRPGNYSRFTGYVCCARVYVQLTDRVSAKGKRQLDRFGLRVTSRPHHCNAIYLGYDNASGLEYGRAMAVAAALKGHGVNCYEDADMD